MPRTVGKYQNVVAFYDVGKEYDWMANTFRNKPVNIDGVKWPTTEHYFHAMKFPGNSPAEIAYRQAILNYSGSFRDFPQFAKNAAKEQHLKRNWQQWDGTPGQMDGQSHAIMRKAVRAKLEQYPEFKQQLLSLPADAIIVEATKNDSKWADHNDGSGTNHLGIIYMELLQEYKNKLSPQAAQQKAYTDYQQFNQYRQQHYSGKTLYDPAFVQHPVLPAEKPPPFVAPVAPHHPAKKAPSPVATGGAFVPTRIDYQHKSTDDQAHAILAQVEMLHQRGHAKVGITYSANHDQTEEIRRRYAAGDWRTGTSGGNQAAVIAAVENLLKQPKYQHLQGVFQVVPITTCAHSGGVGAVKDQWLDQDLAAAKKLMAEGGALLGWQNENTIKSATRPFAIGGSISQELTPAQKHKIQHTLMSYSTTFPAVGLTHRTPTSHTSAIFARLDGDAHVKPTGCYKLPRDAVITPPTPTSVSSEAIGTKIQSLCGTDTSPLIARGEMNNTFKVVFDNPKDAQAFYEYLKQSFPDVTYWNNTAGKEKYGVESPPGSGKHLHDVVRFEAPDGFPAGALTFLKEHLKVPNADKLYKGIMGDVAVDKKAKEAPDPVERRLRF